MCTSRRIELTRHEQKFMKKNVEPLKPGVYFGLADKRYHDDPALSRSDMMKLLESPQEYWFTSWMNPKRKERKTTKAMDFGRKLHLLVLEPQEFKKKYSVGGGDLGKRWMSSEEYEELNDIRDSLMMLKEAQLWFHNGFSEVSIFWECEETGIMLKARHDYFLVPGSTDLKSVRSLHDRTLWYDFENHGYPMQAVHYTDSRVAAKKLLVEHGATPCFDGVRMPDAHWWQRFMECQLNILAFFCWKKEYPYASGLRFVGQQELDSARSDINHAKQLWLLHFKDGTDCPEIHTGGSKEISRYGSTQI